jgi:drug/metabolite transporter (DMT)-like permease
MVDGTRHGVSAGREGGWYHSSPGPPDEPAAPRGLGVAFTLARVTAILGGLIAAALWAAATLASSRSSRMLGSRVVLGWVMLIGVFVGVPLALLDAPVERLEPSTLGLLLLAGVCYVAGLGLTYAALQIGKVSIVAPIVATEGAVAAVIAVSLGDAVGLSVGILLAVIAVGVVLSSIERSGTDVPAGDTDLVADALDGPPSPSALSHTPPIAPGDTRKSTVLAVVAALIFGVGLFASGTAASLVPVAWVALSARVVGVVLITLPLLFRGRLRLTRAALPLLVIAGVGEIVGSMASSWGARESIAIVAVLGSQFAAFSAVVAFLLFGERLSRIQVIGVVLVVVGVTALAAVQA